MAAQAWFTTTEIDVIPGTAAVVELTVLNLSDHTDNFVLTPVGMAAGWTTIQPAMVTLFGGARQTVSVELRPPMLPSTTSGPTSLAVRVVPHDDPDNTADAEATVVVAGIFDRHVDLLQPAQRGRRRATFEMVVENRGNALASCRMHLSDPSGRLEGDFDPPAVGVEPGANTLVRMRLRTNGVHWARTPRTVPFRVEAMQPGVPAAVADGVFVQAPMVPERIGSRLLGTVVACGLLAAAWFALLKPLVRDTARDAAHGVAPATATTVPDPGGTPGSTIAPGDAAATTVPGASTSGPATGDASRGELTSFQLPVSVATAQTGSADFTVPAGKRLQVTDLVIQNPQLDSGSLIIGRDTVNLLSYNLGQLFSDVVVPLVSPLEFRAGEKVVVTVTCTGLTDATATACNPNVLVSGLLLDT